MKVGHFVPAYGSRVSTGLLEQSHRDAEMIDKSGHQYVIWTRDSSDLPGVRNTALHEAMERGLDFLIMQDSDVYCQAAASPVVGLIGTALDEGAAVVGAAVPLRNLSGINVNPYKPGEVFECESIGAGLIAIDLNKIREWYYEHDGPCFARIYSDNRQTEVKVSEDIFFVWLVRTKGQRVVCDGRIPMRHEFMDGKTSSAIKPPTPLVDVNGHAIP